MPSPSEVRSALVGLTALARRELRQAWVVVEGRNAEQVRDFLMDVVPAIADKYGVAAAALAADWYDEVRDQAGAAGRFLAEPAPLPHSSRYEALVRWGVDPLYQGAPDELAALARVAGGLQKIVVNMHGQTLTESAERDPAAQGWGRQARGDGCDVCKALAGRGFVYKGATADFATHDHCHCVAVPEFGKVRDVRDYERSKRFAVDAAGEAKRKAANQSIRAFAENT